MFKYHCGTSTGHEVLVRQHHVKISGQMVKLDLAGRRPDPERVRNRAAASTLLRHATLPLSEVVANWGRRRRRGGPSNEEARLTRSPRCPVQPRQQRRRCQAHPAHDRGTGTADEERPRARTPERARVHGQPDARQARREEALRPESTAHEIRALLPALRIVSGEIHVARGARARGAHEAEHEGREGRFGRDARRGAVARRHERNDAGEEAVPR